MTAFDDVYELTPLQQGMLFHSVYAPESDVYNTQLHFLLDGDVDVRACEQVWHELVRRHAVLRTSFEWEGLEKPYQVVHREVGVAVTWHDWRQLPVLERQSRLEAFLAHDRRQAFRLSEPPLTRLSLLRLTDTETRFVWTFHHIILEGWSASVVLSEFRELYGARRRGEDVQLPTVRPYREYIRWLQQQDAATTERYWRERLAGFAEPTRLPVDRGVGLAPAKVVEWDERKTRLSRKTSRALGSLAKRHRVTLNTVLQGTWAILLSRYTNTTDVVFGTVVSGRPPDLQGAERMVGLFVNTLPTRVKVGAEEALVPWLQRLQEQQVEMRQYEHSSLVEVQGWSEVGGGQPLFDNLLVFENWFGDGTGRGQADDLEIRGLASRGGTDYPLALVVVPGSELVLDIMYDRQRFDDRDVDRMMNHLTTLLESIVVNPERRLCDFSILTPSEEHQLLRDWNDTDEEYRRDLCVHQLFERRARGAPDSLAVACGGKHLTYGELEQRASRLAHRLQNLGVGPETLVGLCVERSVEMVIGMVGVVKAGGAYVPLDPSYPRERLAYMVRDSEARVLLTQRRVWDQVGKLEDEWEEELVVLCLDADWETDVVEGTSEVVNEVSSENLAYVIYTSGSTGHPKGVAIEHRSLMNLVTWHQRAYGLRATDRTTQVASFSFDASVWELWPALTSGASVHIANDSTRASPVTLAEWLAAEQITISFLPTPLAEAVLRERWPEGGALRVLLTGGDKLHRGPPRSVPFQVVNHYGPTENTVVATCAPVMPEEVDPPIGRPIVNTRVYVLDGNMVPVPLGIAGELYIGGASLARGYVNRPDLTAQQFVADPFSSDPEARLYRTGDVVRYRADGNLEFLGRNDAQVKIRGFRVELGEVEAAVCEHPGVADSVVIIHDDVHGSRRLVAYVVPAAEPLPWEELRTFLGARLPEYMVPALFVRLPELPLTPNGKVDRRALPDPTNAHPVTKSYVPPKSEAECTVAAIWKEVLHVAEIGAGDDFFALGGHSLLATQAISRLREAFNVNLPLATLFEFPTVAAIAEQVEAAKQTAAAPAGPTLLPIARTSDLAMSFAQQRLWFLDQLEPGLTAYNVPAALRIAGPLNVDALEHTFATIVQRHETLRTTFSTVDGHPIQVVHDVMDFNLETVDLRARSAEEREAEVVRLAQQEERVPFNLADGPLLRARLLQLASAEHVLLLTLHHIVCDAWSIGVLVREMASLYEAFVEGYPPALPPLALQYADFAQWQRRYLSGEVLEAQLSYWREQLADVPQLTLPSDRPRQSIQTYNGSRYIVRMPFSLARAVNDLSRREGSTLFMTVLAAFKVLLHRYTGEVDIAVGTPIANRTRHEIEGLIGFFTNTLVMRTDVGGEPTFRELLARVRKVALDAYSNQDVPFEKLVEELQPERDLSQHPLFQVLFSVQNAPMESLRLLDVTLSAVELESAITHFDLELHINETPEGLTAVFYFNTDLFDQDTIARLGSHLERVLQKAVEHPDVKISELPLLGPSEIEEFDRWNATATAYPREETVHGMFERQVSAGGRDTAVTYQGESLSYEELNEKANQLAHHLREMGIGADDRVAICVERSLEMTVGVLGILKAGAAYVPLDPSYPPERLSFMLADCKAPVMVAHERTRSFVEAATQGGREKEGHGEEEAGMGALTVVYLDRDRDRIGGRKRTNPQGAATADNLAYVLYTSGSTGRPKGVAMGHRPLVNLLCWQMENSHVGRRGRTIQFTSLNFDPSYLELFATWCMGGELVLVDEMQRRDFPRLVKFLNEERVERLFIPFAGLQQLAEAALEEGVVPQNLRELNTAGEQLQVTPQIVTLLSQLEDCVMWNQYGPTEAHVVTAYKLTGLPSSWPLLPPIGVPIFNTQIYVLDMYGNRVPVGVPGELYIGGDCLARGYLDRPELTAAKFVRHQWEEGRGGRLYRTGDVARYLPNGNIEYLGRADSQVKIRGFRVELGEVEAVLSEWPGVAEAAAVVREDVPNAKRLVAYVVLRNGESGDMEELRRFAARKLPDYMVPARIEVLSALPLTPSGKLDRRALPAPSRDRTGSTDSYVAPQTAVEKALADIWAEALAIEQVGTNDNFFSSGGHSLLATQVVSRIRSLLGMEIPLRALFEYPTVAGLAEHIEAVQWVARGQEGPAVTAGVEREDGSI